MIGMKENELMTKTGPGTPGGTLMRQYWHPVALTTDVPFGGAPLPVTILGEDLVLFRDEDRRVGLLGRRCSHRCADLSYGRIENGGLRCLYHGWLYDVSGHCLDTPAEPAGSRLKETVRHVAYPCVERGGLIFAYFGKGTPSPLPAYEFLDMPDRHSAVMKTILQCNWLQALEGNIDPSHLSYLHSSVKPVDKRPVPGSNRSADFYYGDDRSPHLEIETTSFGVRIFSVRHAGDSNKYVRVSNFIMPNKAAVVGNEGRINQGYQVNWHVPIDDHSHYRFDISFNREKPIDQMVDKRREGEVTAEGFLTRNRQNRYRQDRDEMATTFTGMGYYFMAHDAFASESQGVIHDRSHETLGSTDICIAAARRQILEGIENVMNGREPRHARCGETGDDASDIVVLSEVVGENVDHRGLWKKYMDKRRSALEASRD